MLDKPHISYLILASRYMFSDNLYRIPLTIYRLPDTCYLMLATQTCYPQLFLDTCHRKRYIGFFLHNAQCRLHIPDALYWLIYTIFHDKNKVT